MKGACHRGLAAIRRQGAEAAYPEQHMNSDLQEGAQLPEIRGLEEHALWRKCSGPCCATLQYVDVSDHRTPGCLLKWRCYSTLPTAAMTKGFGQSFKAGFAFCGLAAVDLSPVHPLTGLGHALVYTAGST